MKTLILAAIRCSLLFLVPTLIYAIAPNGISIPFPATGIRLELDAEWSAQWPSGYCDFRSFQYDQRLDIGEHGG